MTKRAVSEPQSPANPVTTSPFRRLPRQLLGLTGAWLTGEVSGGRDRRQLWRAAAWREADGAGGLRRGRGEAGEGRGERHLAPSSEEGGPEGAAKGPRGWGKEL